MDIDADRPSRRPCQPRETLISANQPDRRNELSAGTNESINITLGYHHPRKGDLPDAGEVV
jgi:hypothetical protein